MSKPRKEKKKKVMGESELEQGLEGSEEIKYTNEMKSKPKGTHVRNETSYTNVGLMKSKPKKHTQKEPNFTAWDLRF
jgi:hypothetical protein